MEQVLLASMVCYSCLRTWNSRTARTIRRPRTRSCVKGRLIVGACGLFAATTAAVANSTTSVVRITVVVVPVVCGSTTTAASRLVVGVELAVAFHFVMAESVTPRRRIYINSVVNIVERRVMRNIGPGSIPDVNSIELPSGHLIVSNHRNGRLERIDVHIIRRRLVMVNSNGTGIEKKNPSRHDGLRCIDIVGHGIVLHRSRRTGADLNAVLSNKRRWTHTGSVIVFYLG